MIGNTKGKEEGSQSMRRNNKLAASALVIDFISGILGVVYLVALGVKGMNSAALSGSILKMAVPALGMLAAVMAISTLVMIWALSKKR